MAARGKRTRRRKRRAHASIPGNFPTGTIELSAKGFGFVDTDEGSFFIPANRTNGAMPGDVVELRPHSRAASATKRRDATVVRVLSRAASQLVGVLEVNEALCVVVSQDPRVRHDLFVTEGALPDDARDGQLVVAHIDVYPARHVPMQGHVVEVIGPADAPGADVDVIICNAGLPTRFSPQALEQAAGARVDVEAAFAEPGRRDVRDRLTFTIDPHDARDFDDALSLERIPSGLWRLGVHIADVSAYVPEGSSLDICARERATSVYLVDRVLPMLPEKLSNDVCSLVPGAPRLAMTCDMYLDDEACVVSHDIYPSVMQSDCRLTYEQAQGIIDAGSDEDALDAAICNLHALAEKLRARREQQGALEFGVPEARPLLDEAGQVACVELREKTAATSLVEQAMILANETVAAHLSAADRPCVYRVHEPPNPGSLATLAQQLGQLGYNVTLDGDDAQALQAVLHEASGRAEGQLVGMLMLRSMEQAHYSPQLAGHFGLASACYCHFTSPIRRYPDLMVHRLLKDARAMAGQLDELAAHCSRRERIAEAAEDDSRLLKLCEFMEPQLGSCFGACVVALGPHGMRVRLDNTLEGSVRLGGAGEHFEFDALRRVLVSQHTRRVVCLGQRVRVRLESVRVNERRVEFSLVWPLDEIGTQRPERC